MNTSFQQFLEQLRLESILLCRQSKHVINASVMFLMILVFFPLAMPPETQLLKQIAPGLVWVALLFALLISSERLFQQDYEDGVLEQWMVSGHSLIIFVSAKLLVHWLLTLTPLIILSAFVYLLFNFNVYETLILMSSLFLGSPALMYLCALSAVFGGGLKQKGVLMALILLPLTIPVMIFGSGAVGVSFHGLPAQGYLAILAALSVVAVGLLPYAISAIIRISLVD